MRDGPGRSYPYEGAPLPKGGTWAPPRSMGLLEKTGQILKNFLKYSKKNPLMRITAFIEKKEDNVFWVHADDFNPPLSTEGCTVIQAKDLFEKSLREVVNDCSPEDFPEKSQNTEIEYRYDVASLFDCFDWINVTKTAHHIGINPSLMRQYSRGRTYISEKQVEKIERGLRSLGETLASVSLLY